MRIKFTEPVLRRKKSYKTTFLSLFPENQFNCIDKNKKELSSRLFIANRNKIIENNCFLIFQNIKNNITGCLENINLSKKDNWLLKENLEIMRQEISEVEILIGNINCRENIFLRKISSLEDKLRYRNFVLHIAKIISFILFFLLLLIIVFLRIFK